jgi:hypothetical protein
MSDPNDRGQVEQNKNERAEDEAEDVTVDQVHHHFLPTA